AIQYHGYQTDEELAKELGTAAALLSVSSSEAFGMNILQAMSYGVPVIAYNVKYGLNLLVEKDVSGYLAPLGESKAAADHLVRLLTDATPNAKWADMVNTTYQKSQTFDAKAAWQQWQDQLATVPNLFLR
ncbi:glycosyltransferase, partial [Lacticaseibacillus paracasei subsp. paracasei CNCM I-4270]